MLLSSSSVKQSTHSGLHSGLRRECSLYRTVYLANQHTEQASRLSSTHQTPSNALHSQLERQSCTFHILPSYCSLPLYLPLTSPLIVSCLLSFIPCSFYIPVSTFTSFRTPQRRTLHKHTPSSDSSLHTVQFFSSSRTYRHFIQPQRQLPPSSTELHNSGPRPTILLHENQL